MGVEKGSAIEQWFAGGGGAEEGKIAQQGQWLLHVEDGRRQRA